MTPQELKNSILQLAIQGKLVEQRAEEGTAEELFARIQQETRHYAKRQLTWFRKNPAISWIILDKLDNKYEILEKCKKMIAKSQLL